MSITRIYLSLPAIHYHSDLAEFVVNTIHVRWSDALIIFPDPNTETYLRHRKTIDIVVAVPLEDGRVTYGVGGEIELAFERQIPVYLFRMDMFVKLSAPITYLSREKTRALETDFIQARQQRYVDIQHDE